MPFFCVFLRNSRRSLCPDGFRRGLQGAASSRDESRSVRKTVLFEKDGDYDAFIRVVLESLNRSGSSVAYVTALCRSAIGSRNFELDAMGGWNTCQSMERRARNSRIRRGVSGPVQGCSDSTWQTSLIRVCRYVERNASCRKGLVDSAEKWEWSSLYSVRNNCDSHTSRRVANSAS